MDIKFHWLRGGKIVRNSPFNFRFFPPFPTISARHPIMVSALNIFDFSASASTDYPAMYQTMKVLFFYFFYYYFKGITELLFCFSIHFIFSSFHFIPLTHPHFHCFIGSIIRLCAVSVRGVW